MRPMIFVAALLLFTERASAQTRELPLLSTAGVELHNVTATPAELRGKKGLRVTFDSTHAQAVLSGQAEPDQLIRVEGLEFSSGVIEVEAAGSPAPGAFAGARGFVGLAFRLQPDWKTYDAFYIRPTNGRAEDQERRNHATQYISHPSWTWNRLRSESPSKYESYADVVPDEWTKLRIEVRGDHARLYVNGNEQPSLVVNDVKSGASAKGAVALWIGAGTIGYFRNLRIESR